MSEIRKSCGAEPSAEPDTVTIDREEFDLIKAQLSYLDFELTRLLTQPLVHATVVKAENRFDLSVFESGDKVLILDPEVRKKEKDNFLGKLVSQGVDEEGWAIVEVPGGNRHRLNIGLNGDVPQIKLISGADSRRKDDGTNVTITTDGKLFEVHGLPGVFFNPADNVKVNMETRQIHESAGVSSAGDVACVKSVVDQEHIEVESNGTSRVVIYGLGEKIKPTDRVMLDNSSTVIIRILEEDQKDQFNLVADTNTTWDDVAGLETAKIELKEAIELPYEHPELYKFYNMTPPKGILMYGPPGCGKTLAARATAASLARLHGKQNFQSGFIYVKGPELLSKWVGQSEATIRSLFSRGKMHHERHGYPALLFIDEADAILPMRGTGKSSDVENTIVPQFLSEMDGLEESHVMVLLATNQPRRIDPAALRPGRCDRHVKIPRPTLANSGDYFDIHMKDLPLAKGVESEEVKVIACQHIFDEKKVMYRVIHNKKPELFRFEHSVSGAMIAGVCKKAKSLAMQRDLTHKGKPKGVLPQDFIDSVNHHYYQQADSNMTFDLEDFCDEMGLDRKSVSLEKMQIVKV